MPPRGNEGLDFTPILTHYLFLFTSILSIVSRAHIFIDEQQLDIYFQPQIAWFIAFISQAIVTASVRGEYDARV